jgi:hypothetical protein
MVIYAVFEVMIQLMGLLIASFFLKEIGIIRYASIAGHVAGILIDLGYPDI